MDDDTMLDAMTEEELRQQILELRKQLKESKKCSTRSAKSCKTCQPALINNIDSSFVSPVDKETLKAMLRREHELRTSPETQARYTAAERLPNTDWLEVTIELQKQVAREFLPLDATDHDVDVLVHALRCASNLFHDDPEMKTIPLYVKYNRAQQGYLKEGDDAPLDINLVDLYCRQRLKLRDFLRGRPLILVAGSYTWYVNGSRLASTLLPRWYSAPHTLTPLFFGACPSHNRPPMRGLVPSFHSLLDEFQFTNVDFLCIYITEAHAQDEWPISSVRYSHDGNPVIFNQPRTNEERCAIARQFVQNYQFRMPMVVDTIENEFDNHYSPWPIRFYIINEHGKLVYKAQPKNCSYDVSELRTWILRNCSA